MSDDYPETGLVRQDGALTPSRPASPARVYLDRFPNAHSRAAMLGSLRAILRVSIADEPLPDPLDFPWHRIGDYETLNKVRGALAARYKPKSVARHIAALAGVLRVSVRLGLYPETRLREMVERGGPLHTPKTDTPPAGRMLSPEEVIEAIEAGERKARPSGALNRFSLRDMAILAVAAFTGLRRFEIAALRLEDLDLEGGNARVLGKGNKERDVPLPDGARGRIESYLNDRGTDPGPLFYRGVRGGGRLVKQGISAGTVYGVILAACAKLESRATPHDFRRTFASTLIDEGVDLVTVRDLMGHSNIQTTIRYDRRGDARKKRAVSILDDVFRRK